MIFCILNFILHSLFPSLHKSVSFINESSSARSFILICLEIKQKDTSLNFANFSFFYVLKSGLNFFVNLYHFLSNLFIKTICEILGCQIRNHVPPYLSQIGTTTSLRWKMQGLTVPIRGGPVFPNPKEV